MTMALVILGLVVVAQIALLYFQQEKHANQTQKLVDKLMSRNYAEYSQSVTLSHSTKATSPKEEFQLDEPEEDFRTLEGIGL